MRRALLSVGAVVVTVLAAACGSSAPSSSSSSSNARVNLRLGFLADLTDAPALVGLHKEFFRSNLPPNVVIDFKVFHSADSETTALLDGQIDAVYMNPNQAITAWQRSHGTAIKIISGAASGGASLVVKPGITGAGQLKGKSLATPSLGGTPDVALRYWLKQHGLTTTPTGGGDVAVRPTATISAAVPEFTSGQIEGGWEPVPYDVEMVANGGTRLVNEASLWPNGQFATTNLVVTQSFLKAHTSLVSGLLKGQVQANNYIKEHQTAAEQAVNAMLIQLNGKGLTRSILASSFKEITFTDNPDASSVAADAQHAEAVGLLNPVNLSGIYDLGPLNKVLAAQGEPRVSS